MWKDMKVWNTSKNFSKLDKLTSFVVCFKFVKVFLKLNNIKMKKFISKKLINWLKLVIWGLKFQKLYWIKEIKIYLFLISKYSHFKLK